jgi:hypothetical protein
MEIAQRRDCHPKIQTAVILEKRPYLILLHFNYFSLQRSSKFATHQVPRFFYRKEHTCFLCNTSFSSLSFATSSSSFCVWACKTQKQKVT